MRAYRLGLLFLSSLRYSNNCAGDGGDDPEQREADYQAQRAADDVVTGDVRHWFLPCEARGDYRGEPDQCDDGEFGRDVAALGPLWRAFDLHHATSCF